MMAARLDPHAADDAWSKFHVHMVVKPVASLPAYCCTCRRRKWEKARNERLEREVAWREGWADRREAVSACLLLPCLAAAAASSALTTPAFPPFAAAWESFCSAGTRGLAAAAAARMTKVPLLFLLFGVLCRGCCCVRS